MSLDSSGLILIVYEVIVYLIFRNYAKIPEEYELAVI